MTDCDGENAETDSSIDFAMDCGYITAEEYGRLQAASAEIGRRLGAMIKNPHPWLISGR